MELEDVPVRDDVLATDLLAVETTRPPHPGVLDLLGHLPVHEASYVGNGAAVTNRLRPQDYILQTMGSGGGIGAVDGDTMTVTIDYGGGWWQFSR